MPTILIALALFAVHAEAQQSVRPRGQQALQTNARRNILLLLPDPPGRPNSTQVLEGVQSVLRAADPNIALAADYVSQEGQDRPGFVGAQLAWYREKYRGKNFDAIIALGPETLLTLVGLRQEMWPGVPVVFCGGGRERVAPILKQTGFTGTLLPPELMDNLGVMRQILPGLRHIAIAGGASQVDKNYNARTITVVRQAFPNIDLIDLTQLRIADLKIRAAGLPPDSALLLANFFYDPDGRPVFRGELVSALAPATTAPMFATGDVAMGSGIVGGKLTHYEWLGNRAAEIALRILGGEKPSDIPVEIGHVSSLQFDARELDRWHIPLSRLPAGSEILNRPFSVWEHYGWAIALAVLGITLEALLIARLLYQRRRARETEAARLRAELDAAGARDEISHLNRVASMGELATSLAHELNQPLAGILSNAQAAQRFLAQSPPDLAEVNAALSDIRDDDQRAGEIIRRMRQMLKKQSGNAESVDVNAAVADALSLLRTDAVLRNISLDFEPSPEAGLISADPVQLRQVIVNLVLNAMEAVRGEGRVVVKTAAGEGTDMGGALIRVSDSGPGIPPKIAERVFEPFFSTKEDGLGMGLSIVSSIVTAHGGKIRLEDGGGGGATFLVAWPAARRTARIGMTPAIFLIDDDASVLRGLTRLLKSAGYHVEPFASAGELLARPPVERAGCILTDLRMPGMSGLELQDALARAGVQLPVIFFSGDADVPATVRALKGGALDFLTKPIDETALLDALKAAIERDACAREDRAKFQTLTPREREVCRLVARGMANKQVAFELGTVEKTVKVHRARVMGKLGVKSVAELVRFVDRLGQL